VIIRHYYGYRKPRVFKDKGAWWVEFPRRRAGAVTEQDRFRCVDYHHALALALTRVEIAEVHV
jgi:hypothetical protein